MSNEKNVSDDVFDVSDVVVVVVVDDDVDVGNTFASTLC
jgi:hypothetical protein